MPRINKLNGKIVLEITLEDNKPTVTSVGGTWNMSDLDLAFKMPVILSRNTVNITDQLCDLLLTN